MKKIGSLLIFLIMSFLFLGIEKVSSEIIDFEDLYLDSESYWNGSDASGGFVSSGVFFNNNYDPIYGSWDGFSYSNRTGTEVNDWESLWEEQFNVITGGGVKGSKTYVIGYLNTFSNATLPTITFPEEQKITGAYFTNTVYSYYAMLNGYYPAIQFGVNDWFKLTITAKDSEGNITGTVDVFLAQGGNIIDTWEWKDLSGLGKLKTLEFTLSSSDNGLYGMNTPAYFCMDDLEFLYQDSNGRNELLEESYDDIVETWLKDSNSEKNSICFISILKGI